MNPYNYDLYFDGANVRLSMSQAAISSDPIASNLNIPCNARFFSIRFFGWNGLSTAFDGGTVANVSVITKAYEALPSSKGSLRLSLMSKMSPSSRIAWERLIREPTWRSWVNDELHVRRFWQSRFPLQYTSEIGLLITLDGVNAGSDLSILGAPWDSAKTCSNLSRIIRPIRESPLYRHSIMKTPMLMLMACPFRPSI